VIFFFTFHSNGENLRAHGCTMGGASRAAAQAAPIRKGCLNVIGIFGNMVPVPHAKKKSTKITHNLGTGPQKFRQDCPRPKTISV